MGTSDTLSGTPYLGRFIWDELSETHLAPSARPTAQSSLTPAVFTTFDHMSSSARSIEPSSPGELLTDAPPCSCTNVFMSARATTLAVSALSVPTMSFGVAAGTKSAYQFMMVTFGYPDSAMVGVSGRWDERTEVLTASARSLPALTCWSSTGRSANAICSWPAIKSIVAGPMPL